MKAQLKPKAFPKKFRLLRRAEFRRVYEEGQRRSATLCTIFYLANGLDHARLGITTSRKLGKAALRNRLKRRFREAFRLSRTELPTGWDVVINPRPAAAEIPFDRVTAELARLMPKAAPQRSAESSATPLRSSSSH